MPEFPIGLREVIPNQTAANQGRDFIISTGGSQSTLQEIKLPDGAGGFSYFTNGGAGPECFHRNRFITWRVSHDLLELSETSLDFTLLGAKVRYRFQDSPILSNGVSVHETLNSVVVLVATVGSVHKMVFPHPKKILKLNGYLMKNPQEGIPSVFSEASPNHAKEYCNIIHSSGTAPMPHLAATYLTPSEEALFALSNSSGQITLVKLDNVKGLVSTNQLKTGSYLGRLWGNFGGILAKKDEGSETATSLQIHPARNDIYVFGICKDNRLRMWSTTTLECVMSEDPLTYSTQDMASHLPGSQNHVLRKIVDPNGGKDMALAVFLSSAKNSHFVIVKPTLVDGQFQLEHVATVYAPELDLVDFQVNTSQIWALWTNASNEPILRYVSFASNSSSGRSSGANNSTGWKDVAIEDALGAEFELGDTQPDPRQAYLRQIFYPGRFSIQTLSKTVRIYRRSVTTADKKSNQNLENSNMEVIREEICQAVEADIQNQVTEYEISDEDYVAICHSAWSKFYSCALQYHQAGLKPMGLLVDMRSGLICLIKKSTFSFVRPVDALEHLVLATEEDVVSPEIFKDTPILCEDHALSKDVINLMKAISLVDTLIPPDLVEEFSHSLSRLYSPDLSGKKIARFLMNQRNENDVNVAQELSTRLQQVCDITKALEVLLISLELDRGIVSHLRSNEMMEEDGRNESNGTDKSFASPMGVSILNESLAQVTRTRFDLSRDLLVLQFLMLECGLSDKVTADALEKIHSTFLPMTVVMSHCYFVLVWLTETLATAPPPNSLEQGLRQMAVLKISNENSTSAQLAQLTRLSARPLTLSELFLLGPGGNRGRSLLTMDTDHSASWQSVLMPLVNISAQLLWPRCTSPSFQEFLLSACQHLQIQEYVRLLKTWCDWNCHSRQFLLGSAFLNMGEPEKAADWLVQAGGGVGKDRFLMRHLFSNDEVADGERLQVLYYLKVIELFKQFGYHDYVIELAKTALEICDEDDPNRTTLCYILFSHHLKLGHNDEAYDAMILNPDKTRRKDSLRQFVVTLFERRNLRQLATYPYVDMFEDLEQIIEARARSVDLAVNNYYDFLYSFNVTKENYRKAAQVMYECGMRLGTELFTPEGLKRQAQCYLACLNALKLVNAKYAWIVKPITNGKRNSSDSELPQGMSPKRNSDGEEMLQTLEELNRPKIQVLEMVEIEKEFELVCARLKLMKKNSSGNVISISGPGLSSGETVALLASANLFEDAVQIAKIFDLDFKSIIDALTSKCVRLSTRASHAEKDQAWDWLSSNSVDSLQSQNNVVDAAWNLLENFLSRLELPGQSFLHKSVATKLLELRADLPAWLIASYKKANAAELLRLYLKHGLLENASRLAVEYINAVLGSGKEYFGLDSALNANARSTWLPFNALEQLLLELDYNSQDPVFSKLKQELDATLENYLSTVERVSKDMVELRRRRNQ